MISNDEAERIADEILRARPEDVDQGWSFQEFGAGWLIERNSTAGRRGGASIVIERANGRVMRFPSYIPPTRILEEYDQVVAAGQPDERFA